jgi:hypothetical protein
MSDSILYLDMFPQKEAAKIAMLSRAAACQELAVSFGCAASFKELQQLFHVKLYYKLPVLGTN